MHPLLWKHFHRDRYRELLRQAEVKRLLKSDVPEGYTAGQVLMLNLGRILVKWGQRLEQHGQPYCNASSSSISR